MMNNMQKTSKKLFCAPIRKTDSSKICHDDSKDKKKRPTLSDNTDINEKKINTQNHTMAETLKKGKPQPKPKSIPKSMTDEEYSDIFNSVLNKALNENYLQREALEDVHRNTHELILPKSVNKACLAEKTSEDELDEIATNLPIDQWNERSEDTNQKLKKTSAVKKKNKEKLKIKNSTKKEKKSKKNNLLNEDAFHKSTRSDLLGYNKENNDNHEQEELGTWIQCSISKCGKWRYVEDVSDPINVQDDWDCSMNSDKDHNTCNAPEQEYDESEHILTKFTLGSIVWAKMDGFPWWPAMIDTDPDYDTYFELPTATSMMPMMLRKMDFNPFMLTEGQKFRWSLNWKSKYMYHVTFFDELVSRAWIRSHLITPYDHKSMLINKVPTKSQFHKKDLETAKTNAMSALKLSLQDRLDKYSFLKRYSKAKRAKDPLRKIRNEKKNMTEEVLSTPGTMLRELEMAIENCNYSNDTDCSDERDEYLPQASASRARKRILSHEEEQNGKQENKPASDSEPDGETVANCKKKGIIKQQNNGKHMCKPYDPDIFTMELSSNQMDHKKMQDEHDGISLQEPDNSCDEEESIKVDIINESNQTVSSTEATKISKHPVEHMNKLKCKKKRKNGKSSQDASFTNAKKKRKSDCLKSVVKEERKEKLINEVVPAIKSDTVDKKVLEYDSEKENIDPKDTKEEEQNLLSSSKRKYESYVTKITTSKKQKKISATQNEQGRNEYKSELEGSEGIGKLRKNEIELNLTAGNLKKKMEEQFICDINKYKEPTHLDKTAVDCSNIACRKKEKKHKRISHSGKETRDNKNHKFILDKMSFNVNSKRTESYNIKKKETEIEVKTKANSKKERSKRFIIPAAKDKSFSKSGDRDVPNSDPVVENNKSKKHKSQYEYDQFVPDVANELMEDELDFSSDEIEYSKSKNNGKKRSEESCAEEEELNLSMDSLEDDCLDINVNTKDITNGNGNTPEDKNEYGRFGGHCSDHRSDSDPFELIED